MPLRSWGSGVVVIFVALTACDEPPATDPLGGSHSATPLKLIEFTPQHRPGGHPVDVAVTLRFSAALDAASVREAVGITPADGYVTRVLGDRFIVTPRSLWRGETTYELVAGTTLRAPDTGGLEGPITVRFTTGPAHRLVAAWGETGAGPGEFHIPYGADIDEARGILYISDCRNDRVHAFDLDGTLIRSIGSSGAGPGQLDQPADVKVDSRGYVWVVEELNHRVQVFTPEGEHERFLGSFGSGPGEFDNPLGLAIDAQDRVFVVDYLNHRIQRFAPDGTFELAWGRSGRGDAEFDGPYYAEIDDAGFLYVTDRGNHRIQKFTLDGEFVTRWGRNGGDGSAGAEPGSFDWPHEIAVDTLGRVYVADTYNSRVQVFDPAGTYLHSLGDGETMTWPKSVAVTSEGIVFVADPLARLGVHVTRWNPNLATDAADQPVRRHAPGFPPWLSELPEADDLPDRTIGYRPRWPLWTNGSHKDRRLVLPPGGAIDNSRPDVWRLPVGSYLFKTFAYLEETADGFVRDRPVETRVLRRDVAGWSTAVYLWEDDGHDALLLDGSRRVAVPIFDARRGPLEHVVPSAADCQTCHASNTPFVLGFSPWQLSTPPTRGGPSELERIAAQGVFSHPVGGAPVLDAPDALAREIAGYVLGNCVGCHNGKRAFAMGPERFVERTVGRAAPRGGVLIAPGDPEGSRIYELLRDGEMPPLGVQVPDTGFTRQLRDWILSLEN